MSSKSKPKSKKKEKSVEEEINEFLQMWNISITGQFIGHAYSLMEIYGLDKNGEWNFKKTDHDGAVVRITQIVYIMSQIAEFYAARFLGLNQHFPKLWRRMEKEVQKNRINEINNQDQA